MEAAGVDRRLTVVSNADSASRGCAMVLLRRVIGDALRARRQGQHRTLREVSTAANVSLGYLSEIERGQKEASSELLASICAHTLAGNTRGTFSTNPPPVICARPLMFTSRSAANTGLT